MVVNQRKKIGKPWGHEEILHESDDLVVLRMFLKAGEETSLHKHLKRDEMFTVLWSSVGGGSHSVRGRFWWWRREGNIAGSPTRIRS